MQLYATVCDKRLSARNANVRILTEYVVVLPSVESSIESIRDKFVNRLIDGDKLSAHFPSAYHFLLQTKDDDDDANADDWSASVLCSGE